MINAKQWQKWLEEHGRVYVVGEFEFGNDRGTRLIRPGYLFSNGAFVADDGSQWLLPPEDPVHKAIMAKQYHEVPLRNAEKEFATTKANAHSEACIQRLKELRKVVLELRKKVEECDQVIANGPEAVAKRERAKRIEASNRQQRIRKAKLQKQVSKIEL